ncbi:hypothetical protein DSCO28_09030 [Desulfosarcina ovata subsp. sediminis]|uniref:Uncharacterized protein n=1 Tax=Desulfosarcina ovata subsp. sediminis TaxID=885957 RepID=A0A5K7ZK30_9BACT|nr:hypothetical protein DSCO28_09030 [Desulfosarcina ovata subsp. sediminis]
MQMPSDSTAMNAKCFLRDPKNKEEKFAVAHWLLPVNGHAIGQRNGDIAKPCNPTPVCQKSSAGPEKNRCHNRS